MFINQGLVKLSYTCSGMLYTHWKDDVDLDLSMWKYI